MNALAVIPARGGSKRIPGKNIRDFLGSPIISYSIKSALESELFDEVMVSTDSDEIADIAQHYGAVVPFLRSADSANDYATLADVLLETITSYRKINKDWDLIACILPTAPFIRPEDLKEAYSLLIDTSSDGVVSVARFSYPIQRALRIDNGKVSMANPEYYLSRSQDLEPRYHDAGQFYLIKKETLIREKTMFCKSAAGYEMEELRVQDIDNRI